MLQQTQVKTVIPYWQRWMRELPTAQALARARPQKVLKLWEGLGYYTRARNLQKAAQQIIRDHAGMFPRNFEEILALPGIGRYTAGAISSIAYNDPAPILDGNVIRVLTRLFGIEDDPRARETNACLWHLAEQLVGSAGKLIAPEPSHDFQLAGSCSALNQSLMELGALVCTPRQPQCSACPLATRCEAQKTGRAEVLPRLAPRAPATPLRFVTVLAERDGKWLVRQRPAGVVNAQLWEFPNVEVTGGSLDEKSIREHFFGPEWPGTLLPFLTLRHAITRYQITLEAYRAELNKSQPPPLHEGQWRQLDDLSRLPFSSAHRRLLNQLLALPGDGRRTSTYGSNGVGQTARTSAGKTFPAGPRRK